MENEKIEKLLYIYATEYVTHSMLMLLDGINVLEKFKNNISDYSRAERRRIEKELCDGKTCEECICDITNQLNNLKKISVICLQKNIDSMEDKKIKMLLKLEPIEEEEFSFLVQDLVGFYLNINYYKESNMESYKLTETLGDNWLLKIIGYFVKISKQYISSSIYDCFNDDGSLNIDNVFDFKQIIHNMSLNGFRYKYNNKVLKFTKSEIESMIIKSVDLEAARERQRYLSSLNKCEKPLHNLKAEKIESQIIIKKETEYSELEKEIYSKYINPISLSLRKNVIDIISYEELENIISQLPNMNKAKLNEYKISYINMYVDKQVNKVIKLLDEENSKLLKKVLLNDKVKVYKELYELLYNKELNEEQMVNIIIEYNKKYKKIEAVKQNQNLIIFPNYEFFLDELDTISKMPSCQDKTPLINHIYKCFEMLQSQPMQELSKNNSDAFHKIKIGSEDYMVGKHKAYRFGARKSKICLFRINVAFENQEILKEKYNLDSNFSIFLVSGFGNVIIEDEHELYKRMMKNCFNLEDNIEYIDSIFSNSFTDETFNKACDYIDSSMLQINDNIETIKVLTKM